MEDSPHTTCTAHSGLNVKVNILLTLSTVAVGLLVALVPVASTIQAGILANSAKVDEIDKSIHELSARTEGQVERVHTRLRSLERESHTHGVE